MGFKGIIITDAMGMGGVRSVPNSCIKAIKAGIDVLLMPVDEFKEVDAIVNAMKTDHVLATRVEASVRKVLKMKICQGLID